MMRADAIVSGVRLDMCVACCGQVASFTGVVELLSPKKECDHSFAPEREYHVVSGRRRGFARKILSDY